MRWPSLPFDENPLRAELARFDAALPIERAHMPPASWYVDPRFLELERRAVFGASWLPACRADEVTAAGAYAAGCIAGLPYLVVRGADGVLRAFHNSCRHKGREVVVGRGVAAEALVCGYHAWSYDHDGRLRSAPRVAGIEDFDRGDFSLRPMAVHALGPWVFVHCDAAAAPPRWGELERRLAARGWERYRWVESREFTVAANWKIVVDNYLDGGYHVPHMHPSLDAQIDMKSYTTELFDGYSIQHVLGVRERVGAGADYAWIYPSFMINAYGRCIDSNVVVPIAHDRCLIRYDFFFLDGEGDRESIAQSEVTQREDTAICESVHIGLGSPSYQGGRYAPRVEMGEHHFHRLLAAGYAAALG
jgi:choline monooxygenase